MKKFFLVTALAVSTALGGCAGMTPVQIASTISQYEQEVQADANLVCGFVPTVASILALIPTVGNVAPAASAVAEAICSAIASAPTPAASARLKSLASPGLKVNVVKVNTPNGPVWVSGSFTR